MKEKFTEKIFRPERDTNSDHQSKLGCSIEYLNKELFIELTNLSCYHLPYLTASVTRLGDILDFGQLF